MQYYNTENPEMSIPFHERSRPDYPERLNMIT